MVTVPNLRDYSVEVLVSLWNNAYDDIEREDIKNVIIKKILFTSSPMFYLVNKFIKSKGVLREVYAKVILMRLQDETYNLDDNLINEILSLVSLDDLVNYGSNVRSLEIRDKCRELFWNNALKYENNEEMERKDAIHRRRVLVNKLKMEG